MEISLGRDEVHLHRSDKKRRNRISPMALRIACPFVIKKVSVPLDIELGKHVETPVTIWDLVNQFRLVS